MGKQEESGENLEKHDKTGRIRGERRKPWEKSESQGKHTKNMRIQGESEENRKTREKRANPVKTEKHWKTGRLRAKQKNMEKQEESRKT